MLVVTRLCSSRVMMVKLLSLLFLLEPSFGLESFDERDCTTWT